jgi:hypothetical protein
LFGGDSKAPEERRLMEASSQRGWSNMIEIVWEFVVKEEARGQFELVYGPGGARNPPIA